MEKQLLLDWFLIESTPDLIEESISKSGKIIDITPPKDKDKF